MTKFKNHFDFKDNSPAKFEFQTMSTECPMCNRHIVFRVPDDYVNWEKVAEDYREYANKIWMECNLLLSESGCDTLLTTQLRSLLKRTAKYIEGLDNPPKVA